jgi:pimeloyl-ACP methyl ester carboxylesterase
MPYIEANGVTLHTQAMGDGPPVIMLHGLMVGSMATWYFTAAPTLARSRRVILYDLRGHGRSTRPKAGYDVETMSADLSSVMDHYLESSDAAVSLVGHSYGALIALHYALSHPERVSRLALVEMPLPPTQLDDLGVFFDRTPEEMVAALPEPLQRVLGDPNQPSRRGRRLLKALHELAFETSVLRDVEQQTDIADAALSRFTSPVLTLYGETSSCRSTGERLARVWPEGTHNVLAGGHYLPTESPAQVTDRLEGFLNG